MLLKIVTTIFSVYILALTTIPCVDKLDLGALHRAEVPQNATDSHPQECDHCSPFCTCNCCASPGIQLDNIIEFNSFSYKSEYVSVYKSSSDSFHFTSCWHPPKLS